MTDDMIERVAQAIVDADHGDGCVYPLHRQMARAAIEAMREPSDEMLKAAWGILNCSVDDEMRIVWQAMIDVALKRDKE